jgi:Ser/Thr protein kinase RdoA (MazF antagonist)
MVTPAYQLPDVTAQDAERLLRDVWQLSGELEPLNGERDRNFRLRTADGRLYAFKISNVLEERPILDMQNAALAHCAARAASIELPGVVPTRGGEPIATFTTEDGVPHMARLLTWVHGRPLATARPHSDALLRSLGAALGGVDGALATFAHAAATRTFKWDLVHAEWVAPYVSEIAVAARRDLVARIIEKFGHDIAPRLRATRSGVIYGDANDWNILVRGPGDDAPSRGMTAPSPPAATSNDDALSR